MIKNENTEYLTIIFKFCYQASHDTLTYRISGHNPVVASNCPTFFEGTKNRAIRIQLGRNFVQCRKIQQKESSSETTKEGI